MEELILLEKDRVKLRHPVMGDLDGYRVGRLTWFRLEDVEKVSGKDCAEEWLDTTVERLRQSGIEAVRSREALVDADKYKLGNSILRVLTEEEDK